MSTTSLQQGVCRCCGTITNKCKIITHGYEYLGQTEVYADMLTSAYGIDLSYLQNDNLVCIGCVGRLRSAYTFKMLVLHTEQEFLNTRMVQHTEKFNKKCALELVEAKLMDSFDDYDNLDLDNMPDGLDDELTPELLREYEKLDDIGTHSHNDLLFKNTYNVQRKRNFDTKNKAVKLSISNDNDETNSDEEILSNVKAKLIAKKPMKNNSTYNNINFMLNTNLTSIIKYSYVCPFKNRYNHIFCYYCSQNFVDPELLRNHTLTHDVSTFKYIKSNPNTKIDIKRVDCKLCTDKIYDLDVFKRHLLSVHRKKFYLDSRDCVLPFLLEKDLNKCAICNMDFPSFHELNKHMNVHYAFYICEACGLGFMNQVLLTKHKEKHQKKRLKCKTCNVIFKNKYALEIHIRTIHKKTSTLCNICHKVIHFHERKQHMQEAHGDVSQDYPCIACDKVFKTRVQLTYHLRRAHIMTAYKLACSICDKKFYTKEALNIHMPTHTGQRNFKCKVCEKTYPRMKTLKQHMLIHNNIRRFKCTMCGEAFVQKCSLKGHMKSKHPEFHG